MEKNRWIELKEKRIPISKKEPIGISYAYDSTLVDTEGRKYIDFLGGIGVNALGHSNTKFKEALKEQIDKVILVPNHFLNEPLEKAINELVEYSFADRAYFVNSGAEANEGALKIARKYCHMYSKDTEAREIVAMKKSFHGRTSSAIEVTDSMEFEDGFGESEESFKFVEFNNVKELEETVNDHTSAIILEPVQGEGGVNVATKEFLEKARELADKHHAVLIFDEIQCGMGRTGKLFAYEHFDVEPDVMTLAKALGNGIPVSAVLAKEEFASIMGQKDHSTTYGGNPIAATAVSVALEEINKEETLEMVQEKGEYFREKLEELKEEFSEIEEIRGLGLIVGIAFKEPCTDIPEKLLEKGFIAGCTRENVLRMLPPFVITKEEIDRFVTALREILKK
ncbi:acetylornithine/succinylornithine family transaminase [Peptoniphilus sp. KCTC 25270]|uniref:aspartate aminotransferase family protein n=1 Tax=Peptoniphilus sp. KCTC 25270 TaxID=2897414 RepID=UPI001E3C4B7B|nr:acetylornithine/succinylornithine family transaminase [Peptoniphilus sp. KCTC 25270]MCD1147773.1 acetylornithine/succinylornithine family transaminase [Peptoniphilus sp. KCTC 25270]